ncbi:11787_t:CDS:10 [Entrophospora sp. SA101]|nr:11787_t:CDS:10 [Entrophospora sp. SA101]
MSHKRRHFYYIVERLVQFESILSTKDLNEDHIIDLYKFRHLCFRGIPDEPGIRQKSWKILLGYLPTDKRKWHKTLDENRETYYVSHHQELRNPNFTTDDHPLNSAPNSKWAEYFADNVILEQIDNDVRRTLPDLAFFHLPVPHSSLCPLNLTNDDDMSNYSDSTVMTPNSELDAEVAALEAQLTIIASTSISYNTHIDFYDNNNDFNSKNNPVTPIPTRRSIFRRVQHINKNSVIRGGGGSDGSCDDGEIDLHWEAIERILFIYAKLNPGVGYVQGMNKILGPIYYTMANDSDEKGRAHAEADSFFIFTLLMSHVRDHFVGSLDMDDSTGIGHTMKKLNRRLKNFAYDLWADLEKKGLHPTYYSFRWITVMLTQEFTLPDVIRLWDSIFADRDVEESNKKQLLAGTLQDNIKLLQNYPIQDPLIVLSEAYVMREERLLAKLNGEDIDISSDTEAEDNEYYASYGASGNVYYDNYQNKSLSIYNNKNPITTTTAINATYQRAQEVKLKGLAMLRKVKDVMNEHSEPNDLDALMELQKEGLI